MFIGRKRTAFHTSNPSVSRLPVSKHKMKIKNTKYFAIYALLLGLLASNVFAQKNKKPSELIKRTTFKSETIEFGSGGTISITGAPLGSIQVDGWSKNEVEIKAEIEVMAATEADLKRIAAVCGFALEDSMSQLRITSVGTHDRKYLRKVDRKFPKRLRGAPYKIDYKIKVPHYSDLVIDGGRGDLNLSMVEGTMRIKYLEANAKMHLIGGTIQATIGAGNVDVTVATRSWRGRFAEIQVARGDMNVWLPKNLHANLTARVLRTGKIDNTYKTLKPKRRTKFSDNLMAATAGNGGAELLFTVGDGNLKIGDFEKIAKK